jgi:HPt (histidine-containing phosphotransfer) domain-containing protein
MEPPPGAPPLDSAVLETLERNVGGDVVLMLVAEFLSGVEGRVARLEAASSAGDLRAILMESHDLGTESGSLGLLPLHAAARRIEIAARAADLAAASAVIDGLRALSEPGIAALRSRFPDAG